MQKIFRDPHKMLVRLVGLNVAFDVFSIPIWVILPYTRSSFSSLTLNVDTTIQVVDAAIAAAVFTVALFGILGKRKWGAYLAIAATVAQRVVGVYMFNVNVGMAVEFAWSSLIIFFALKELQRLRACVLPAPPQT